MRYILFPILESEGASIGIFIGDRQNTPYFCNSYYSDEHRRQNSALSTLLVSSWLVNIKCLEPAPEGKAVKILLDKFVWEYVYEIELRGRSLIGKFYFVTCLNIIYHYLPHGISHSRACVAVMKKTNIY